MLCVINTIGASAVAVAMTRVAKGHGMRGVRIRTDSKSQDGASHVRVQFVSRAKKPDSARFQQPDLVRFVCPRGWIRLGLPFPGSGSVRRPVLHPNPAAGLIQNWGGVVEFTSGPRYEGGAGRLLNTTTIVYFQLTNQLTNCTQAGWVGSWSSI